EGALLARLQNLETLVDAQGRAIAVACEVLALVSPKLEPADRHRMRDLAAALEKVNALRTVHRQAQR
ncbi:MAG TPA: hypothetical protein VFA70_05910, partial [Dehalococcoidia bacterium]|nr:hypothetical protein [Dehalococcoidia bacterium]